MKEFIECSADPALTVYIDRVRPEAPVLYRYDYGAEDSEQHATPYQAADMPINDQMAAAMVNMWLEMQSPRGAA